MKELSIDIETYSDCDLASCGVYRYAESPGFALLLFCYSIDGGPVQCVDVASGEYIPAEIRAALTDPAVTKVAHNATFERVCLSSYLDGPLLDPAQWFCTMVGAARLGLPLSLKECGKAIGLTEEKAKMKEGTALIRFFSVPFKGRRRMPADDPERWETFKAYCVRDVEVELEILEHIRRAGMPELPQAEKLLYAADQRINDRGVMIDRKLAENATEMDGEIKAALAEEAKALTGLENPNSPTQIKQFLKDSCGIEVESLNKSTLGDLRSMVQYMPRAGRLIEIREELGKTSPKKYAAMLNCVCRDGRVHGLLQFHGAARTGRWAGRLVQLQNLPQNHLSDIDRARNIVKNGDAEELSLYYKNPTRVLSELVRTAFIAKPGYVFHVCDFSAIEARVVAWLAGEKWVLDVFRDGGDIYCANASKMFGVPVEKHGANAELRPKGKIATLALGYGGGVAALEAMGGSKLGLTEEEEKRIVKLWRNANPCIVRMWATLEKSAIAAIKTGRTINANKGLQFSSSNGYLFVRLPSGRSLSYPHAAVEEEPELGGKDGVTYYGVNQVTKKWEKLRTYGGKMTENVVQAIARDILAEVLLQAEARKIDIVFHVHDEIVCECPEGSPLSDIEALFSRAPEWAAGLPLKGAGYSTKFYLKV